MLEVDLAGVKLRNPVVIASGILGVSRGLFLRLDREGAGAVTTKSVTFEPRSGNPMPNVVELEFGLVNSMGIPNPGIGIMCEEIRSAIPHLSVPIIGSIAPSSAEEARTMASLLVEAGASAVEVNTSCPNVSDIGINLVNRSVELVKAVDREVNVPILVKVTPHVQDVQSFVRALHEAGADGFTAVNTLKAMVIDVDLMRPVLGGVIGGLSGPAVRPVAVRFVYEIRKTLPDVAIIGTGGVESWRDAAEMIMAGANAVGVGTALRKGLKVINEIVDGLRSFLTERGLTLDDIRGIVP